MTLKIPQRPSIGSYAQVPFFKVGDRAKSVMPAKEVARITGRIEHKITRKKEAALILRKQMEAKLAQQKKDTPSYASVWIKEFRKLPKTTIEVLKQPVEKIIKNFQELDKIQQNLVILGLGGGAGLVIREIIKRIKKRTSITDKERNLLEESMERLKNLLK